MTACALPKQVSILPGKNRPVTRAPVRRCPSPAACLPRSSLRTSHDAGAYTRPTMTTYRKYAHRTIVPGKAFRPIASLRHILRQISTPRPKDGIAKQAARSSQSANFNFRWRDLPVEDGRLLGADTPMSIETILSNIWALRSRQSPRPLHFGGDMGCSLESDLSHRP